MLHDDDPAIAALVTDLIFASRIRGASAAAKTVQKPEALLECVGPGTRLVLVDVHARGALEAIRGLRDAGHAMSVVAFGSHVDASALEAARAAGASEVLARSGLVRRLPDLVKEALE